MTNPLGVFEDIHTARRYDLFTLFGVRWLATPNAWMSIPGYLAAGFACAFALHLNQPGTDIVIGGITYGILLLLTNALHSVGHILGGKLAGAPMDANLVTATRHINLYSGSQEGLPSRVHLARASGGPVMNALIGVLALLLWFGLDGGDLLGFFGAINVLAGAGSLLPVRSVDGEVIWRELRRR